MSSETFIRRTHIAAPAQMVFDWHARPGALERLTPPWEAVRVLERTGGIADGGRVVLGVQVGPLRLRWVSEHRDYIPGHQFRDVQVSGPFARWEHTHRVEPAGAEACYLEDRIHYALPGGVLGRLLNGPLVQPRLHRLFDYRHRITKQDILAHAAYTRRQSMHILVTGASGLIGSALEPYLTSGGHQVSRLVRAASRSGAHAYQWNPATGQLDKTAFAGVDAVVHLAGEPIATGRWTPSKKVAIRDSRVHGTRQLCATLAQLDSPPHTFVCASAIGYYGHRGDERLTENSPPGTGFLAEVCRDWEAATAPAVQRGMRVVHLRLGIVLSPCGGVLARMLWPFRIGAGGVMGPGTQFMSWITLDDAVGAIHHALMTETLQGPMNAVAPQAVTNRVFTQTLGQVLRRPTLVPLPAAAARLVFGEVADALLLASIRVEPSRLLASGYTFRDPELTMALCGLLGKQLPHAA